MMPDEYRPNDKTYQLTHPDLDGPMIVESMFSPNVARYQAWHWLSQNLPGFKELDSLPTDLEIEEL